MARSNFTFKKRQKEIERKKKKMEKQERKFNKNAGDEENGPTGPAADTAELAGDVTP